VGTRLSRHVPCTPPDVEAGHATPWSHNGSVDRALSHRQQRSSPAGRPHLARGQGRLEHDRHEDRRHSGIRDGPPRLGGRVRPGRRELPRPLPRSARAPLRPDRGRATDRPRCDLRRAFTLDPHPGGPRCGRGGVRQGLGPDARAAPPRLPGPHHGRLVGRGGPLDLRGAARAPAGRDRAARDGLDRPHPGPAPGPARPRRPRPAWHRGVGPHLLGRRGLLADGGHPDPRADEQPQRRVGCARGHPRRRGRHPLRLDARAHAGGGRPRAGADRALAPVHGARRSPAHRGLERALVAPRHPARGRTPHLRRQRAARVGAEGHHGRRAAEDARARTGRRIKARRRPPVPRRPPRRLRGIVCR
jgi:hypothetical protein